MPSVDVKIVEVIVTVIWRIQTKFFIKEDKRCKYMMLLTKPRILKLFSFYNMLNTCSGLQQKLPGLGNRWVRFVKFWKSSYYIYIYIKIFTTIHSMLFTFIPLEYWHDRINYLCSDKDILANFIPVHTVCCTANQFGFRLQMEWTTKFQRDSEIFFTRVHILF